MFLQSKVRLLGEMGLIQIAETWEEASHVIRENAEFEIRITFQNEKPIHTGVSKHDTVHDLQLYIQVE